MKALLAVLALVLLAGCNTALSTSPLVLVDDALTPDQVAAAEAGMALWEPALHFRHEPMAHELILSHAEAIDGDDVIYLVLSPTADCPGTNHMPHMAGLTHGATVNAAAVSCIDPKLTHHMAAVVAHELGHAMGLDHVPNRALMNPGITSHVPVCVDWMQLADMMGTAVPASCAVTP